MYINCLQFVSNIQMQACGNNEEPWPKPQLQGLDEINLNGRSL
jgi:hypothetical protein